MQKLLLFFALFVSVRTVAQCPYFDACPSNAVLFCDHSTNNPSFWSAPPFSWNPGLVLSDLPEAELELGMVAFDSCGGPDLLVEYTLFLDLDGNDTVETVVRSNALPPSGKVLYNNVLSPNYAEGDTIDFDHRTGLPDSMRYRFGLEISHLSDSVIATLKWTTGITNPNYSLPNFPLGKHRIQWRIEQGGVERFCEYGFEVRDCAPPVVTCYSNLTVNIHTLMPTGIAQIWDSDLLYSFSDNITPPNLLKTGVRKTGQNGFGFPVDVNGSPVYSVVFNCMDVSYDIPAIHVVELWLQDKAGNVDSCLINITVQDNGYLCNNDPTILTVCSQTTTLEPIEDLTCTVGIFDSYLPPPFTLTRKSAPLHHCVRFTGSVPCNSDLTIVPTKNDNPLNGVSTYDLVLISKHILGTEPLYPPYKMIAADVNQSGSITTFDVVELRKLILGIYDTLPQAPSWRFFTSNFVFPNPLNPFETDLPDTLNVENWACTYNSMVFTGIKIGDVNNTAIPNANSPNPAESRNPNFLVIPDLALKAGETFDVPIRTTEHADWLGMQFCLDFDPELIGVESIESSVLPDFDVENWAQPRAGQVSLSWSTASVAEVLPDEPLFHLRIKARANIQLSKVFKTTATPRLQPEVYGLEGEGQPLQFVFSAESALEPMHVFAPQPNPTTMGTSIPVQISQPENIRVEICDLSGKVLWDNDLALGKGIHLLEIPATAMPQTGLYLWRVRAGEILRVGKITRM